MKKAQMAREAERRTKNIASPQGDKPISPIEVCRYAEEGHLRPMCGMQVGFAITDQNRIRCAAVA